MIKVVSIVRIYMLNLSILLCGHSYDYDVVIIGAGASGIVATNTAAQYGLRVALIQEPHIQSRMLNSNIPIKALIHAGETANIMHRAKEFGFTCSNDIWSPEGVFEYVHSVVEHVVENVNIKQLADKNTHILTGKASFIDAHTIALDDRSITTDKCIIATGGRPYIPEINGIDHVPYFTEDTFFRLTKLPKSIIIIGEGPLALELATALHRLGVKVRLITMHGLILPKYDFELINRLQKMMKTEGLQVKYHARIQEVSYENGKTVVTFTNRRNKTLQYRAESLLFALSRAGRVDDMNLEKIGVKYAAYGISVKDTMQTTVPNIYACGNAVEQFSTLSRVSYYQAHIAAQNASKYFWQKEAHIDYSNASSYIHAIRPLGAIGLTEQEARKRYGRHIHIYSYTYTGIAKAHIEKTTEGLIKCICDNNGILLGVHVLGAAADIIIDNVRIGEHFGSQFDGCLTELRTSPNYLDLIREVAKKAAHDYPGSIFTSIIHYIKRII